MMAWVPENFSHVSLLVITTLTKYVGRLKLRSANHPPFNGCGRLTQSWCKSSTLKMRLLVSQCRHFCFHIASDVVCVSLCSLVVLILLQQPVSLSASLIHDTRQTCAVSTDTVERLVSTLSWRLLSCDWILFVAVAALPKGALRHLPRH